MTTQASPPKSPTLLERLSAIEDGAILRFTFSAMLVGTASVLFMDFQNLRSETTAPGSARTGNPVLPAIERPEVDPSDPAYRPQEHVTTPAEILSAPLDIALAADGVLQLTGTITPGAAASFALEIEARGSYVETIALNSPGGSVEDALSIAALIAEKGFDTRVEAGALCASSCPLILAAGATRSVDPGASVGVHQIYAAPDDAARIGSAQAMSDAQMITARIARHFETAGVDAALWLHALETPPDRLYYLTADQMRAYGLVSDAAL